MVDFLSLNGYESPIKKIEEELQIQYEGEILKAVQSCGFEVDKVELARALSYDRRQYQQGHQRGREDERKLILTMSKDFMNDENEKCKCTDCFFRWLEKGKTE